MIAFSAPETPEEIQHQEDWINRTLHADYPSAHVCLHADRTVTVLRPDNPFGRAMIKTECDYCPAVVIVLEGVTVTMVPWYF